MPTGRIEDNDARHLSRNETRKGAAVLTDGGAADTRCLITNVSDDGAELEFDTDQRLPNHFSLSVPHEGVVYRAEVRWREPGRIGVAFLGREERPRATPRAVAV